LQKKRINQCLFGPVAFFSASFGPDTTHTPKLHINYRPKYGKKRNMKAHNPVYPAFSFFLVEEVSTIPASWAGRRASYV
jgi:hypothetical protein